VKYVDEFRSADRVRETVRALDALTTRPWTIMEVCGGQTYAIVKFGLQELLPKKIRLIHGPGCPVCVTPAHIIDHALSIAESGAILCSFGDMLRVPGSSSSLLSAKAKGASVHIVHSPLDALEIARENPSRQVVFLAIGFETTAPANAVSVFQAKKEGIENFSMLCSHVLVPPALEFLVHSPDNEVQAFLAPGHVCTITGESEYRLLCERHSLPIAITGFEPLDILQGIYFCVQMLERGCPDVVNQYSRSVCLEGNQVALSMLDDVFEVRDALWRGIGTIEASGLFLRREYAEFNAEERFPFTSKCSCKEQGCISGEILQGRKRPSECPMFNRQCTPEQPLGAPMVSNEGACAAYYHYCIR